MRLKLIRQALACACLLFLFASTLHSDTRPLPEDLGACHLAQLLTKLKTTARLMQTTAHPDDEDGGMLTLEARGKGAEVTLFTITRGEGGQNKFGTESLMSLASCARWSCWKPTNITGWSSASAM